MAFYSTYRKSRFWMSVRSKNACTKVMMINERKTTKGTNSDAPCRPSRPESYLRATIASDRVHSAAVLNCTTYLTSPECVLSFPRTSSSIPGFPFTLQNGTKTAAWASEGLWAFSPWSYALSRASRMMLHVRRVSGSVSEMSGLDDAAVMPGTAADMNVRSIGQSSCCARARLPRAAVAHPLA